MTTANWQKMAIKEKIENKEKPLETWAALITESLWDRPLGRTISIGVRAGSKPGKRSETGVYNTTNLEAVEEIRKGIRPADFFAAIEELQIFDLTKWADILGVHERTLGRRKKEIEKPFSRLQSERIINIFHVVQRGYEVFEDRDKFLSWLESESMALGGVTPFSLLDTHFGIQLVMDELNRIEHGILA